MPSSDMMTTAVETMESPDMPATTDPAAPAAPTDDSSYPTTSSDSGSDLIPTETETVLYASPSTTSASAAMTTAPTSAVCSYLSTGSDGGPLKGGETITLCPSDIVTMMSTSSMDTGMDNATTYASVVTAGLFATDVTTSSMPTTMANATMSTTAMITSGVGESGMDGMWVVGMMVVVGMASGLGALML